jgi:serine protease Do
MTNRNRTATGAPIALNGRPRTLVGATLLALVALAFTIASRAPDAATPGEAASTPSTSTQAVMVPRQSFADLVERVQPAVVNVATLARVKNASARSQQFNFPEGSPFAEQFREFFKRRFQGPPEGQAPQARGVGSGFFIDDKGHVVTNHHVVKGADEIQITLHDGTELKATVVGHDEKTDLAVLKVEHDKPLPHVSFGNSDSARVGDWVVAMGSPFGLGGTVTAGIISARGRDIRSGPFDDFLQIDAPINRGNSGGPLFDQAGQVIGVNTAIFSPSGGSVGIGFAIPSEMASGVIRSLLADGRVKRGWMGVNIQGLSPELAQSFGLDEPRGALVAGILEGGPAEQAGIAVGDVIVRFNGEDITSMRELPRVVASAKTGTTVPVVVIRSGKERTLTLEVGNMPDAGQVAAARAGTPEIPSQLGIQLAELDDAARAQLGLDSHTQGVVIAQVAPGGAAAREGLRPGDVILRIGNERVKRPADVLDAVRGAAAAEHSSVVMLVSRNGNERFVAVPFERG